MRIVGLICFVTAIMVGIGANLAVMMNLSALLLVGGAFLGGLVISAGPRTGTVLRAAFSATATVEGLRLGVRALRTVRHTTLTGGFFSAGVGAVVVLRELGDPAALGPGLAIGIMGVFYAICLAYFVALPLQTKMERSLAKSEGARIAPTETALDVAVLAGSLAFVAMYMAVLIASFDY